MCMVVLQIDDFVFFNYANAMSTYKVITDVEAEDKIIGPLTFRQFVYALIGGGFAVGAFFGTSASVLITILLAPFALFFFFLAFYSRGNQPAETYLLSIFKTYVSSKKRIWDRDGTIEHVIIDKPKEIHLDYTDKRTYAEVRGSLKQLAQIIDSQGWASKNSSLQVEALHPLQQFINSDDDRLVQVDELLQTSGDISELRESDDPYSRYNESAVRIGSSVTRASNDAKQKAIASMHRYR